MDGVKIHGSAAATCAAGADFLQKEKKILARQTMGALLSRPMKKISLFIQIAALMAGMPAFAISGGPFDNGEYSILLERSGVYEASFSFNNGSGYSQWTADQALGDSSSGGGAGGVSANQGPGSLILSGGRTNNANRTILYYKGVTYVGSAMGQIDTQSRTVQGFVNASSDYTISTSQSTQQSSLLSLNSSSSQTSSTEIVVLSGRGYIANASWTGKITDTAPQLRFSGEGELAILAANGAESIANLAYQGYSGLVAAINQSVARVGQAAQTTFNPAVYTSGSAAIAGILNGAAATPASQTVTPTYAQAVNAANVPVDVNGNGVFNDDLVVSGQTVVAVPAVPGTPSLLSYLDGTGPDNSYAEANVEKIKVTGYRRYF